MRVFANGAVAIILAAAVVSGCQSARLGALDTSRNGRLEPLPASPSGQVRSSQLPPAGQSSFPDAPQPSAPAAPTTPSPTDTASLEQPEEKKPSIQEVPANAPTVTKNAMVGSWRVSSGGSNCQMFLTLTKFGSGSRGGTRGCDGELANLRIWNVSGKQVVLSDENGTVLGRLFASGNNKFDGQTSGGRAVTLSR
ncbi:MAG TPA: protease inhibitor Inh/omp19 family protein [Rhizobiaceae bacterium]|nr:protease inhibitor Inh/omp19 family protein [Rhizobiaceae bacterium]